MNRKHIAALIVVIATLAVVQGTVAIKKNLAKVQAAEKNAQQAAQTVVQQVQLARSDLGKLQTGAAPLVEFLDAWEPYFNSMNSPEGAELAVSMRIKEAGLLTLAQRYETIGIQGNSTIPRAMRANLTIEDEFIKTMNWLGRIESEIPTLRISILRIIKGQLANDIRLELVTEIPLARATNS